MPKDKYVIGVDIGGTHISAAVIDAKNWNLYNENVVRNHVFSQADAKSILQTWAKTIQDCIGLSPDQIQHIGIAMPGPFDYDEGISMMYGQSKYDSLYRKNIKSSLAEELNVNPETISFINDAAAFLQGEIFAQNLHTEDRILGITLGTGLGSSVWNKNEKAFDADLWNTPYNESIFEEHLVTRWFTTRFQELHHIETSGLKEIITNHQTTKAFEILREEYCNHLFNFMLFFSEKHGCNKFIIGGNIAKALPILLKDHKEFEQFEIYTAKLGEKSAMIGAASIFE